MTDEHDVTVEGRVNVPPERAYAAVSDVTRMGEWSPETTSCRWLGTSSGPVAGARFRGANRKGWRRWSTTCSVVVADPGARFAFDVMFGPIPMARWVYEFAPDAGAGGCVVRESWTEKRPRWLIRLDPKIMGVPDRAEHNRATMEITLERLGRALEP
jgi:uncharacterized protein YndB with AHSA1/START domain